MNDCRHRWLLISLVAAVIALAVAIRVGPGNPVSESVFAIDRSVRTFSQSHRTQAGDIVAGFFRTWGAPAGYLPVILGFLLFGWLRSDTQPLRRASRIAGTLALAGLMCWTVKLSVGRERPHWSSNPAVFHPFTSAGSYPSGHTTVAFALSASLAEDLVSPVAITILYGLAAGTAWSRVNDNRHWASDVLAGGLIGLLAILLVRRQWPRNVDLPSHPEAVPTPGHPRPLG